MNYKFQSLYMLIRIPWQPNECLQSAWISIIVQRFETNKQKTPETSVFFTPVLVVEPWGTIPLRCIPSPFYFIRGSLSKLPRLASNFESSYLSLPKSWGNRSVPPCLFLLYPNFLSLTVFLNSLWVSRLHVSVAPWPAHKKMWKQHFMEN